MAVARHWYLLALFGAVVLVYGNSLQGSFHYDDFHSIVANPHIRQLANIPAFFSDPTLFSGDASKAMYRPLLLTTYAFNFALGGYEVVGYHLVNIGLHAINAYLVWWLAQLLWGRRRQALWAALLFALHPICTEPVNYISSRSESLGAVFFLLSFCLFAKGEQKESTWSMAGSLFAFALGLLSKSTVITLPALLLLGDYFFFSRRDFSSLYANLIKRHLPYAILALIYLFIIYGNEFLTRSLGQPVRQPWVQFLTQTEALVYYAKLLILPVALNVEHQFFEQMDIAAVLLASLLAALSFLGALVLFYRRGRDRAFFLSAWMLITLLPVLAVPLNVLVNERRLYLPCIAFCMALSMLLEAGPMVRRSVSGAPLGKVLGLVILVVYGGLVFQRNQVWHDELSLWEDARDKSPAMPRVHAHLGNAWRAADQPQRAHAAFVAALELDAEHRAARTNLANLYYEAAVAAQDENQIQDHYASAVREYQQVLAVDSTYVEALNGLGNAHRMLGHSAAAARAYSRAIAAQPNFSQAHYNLAKLLMDQGEYVQAVASFRNLLALGADADGYVGMGEALFRQDKLDDAATAFSQACQLEPDNPGHYYNLGVILLRQGERIEDVQARRAVWRQARQALERVVALQPGHGQAKALLGQLAGERL